MYDALLAETPCGCFFSTQRVSITSIPLKTVHNQILWCVEKYDIGLAIVKYSTLICTILRYSEHKQVFLISLWMSLSTNAYIWRFICMYAFARYCTICVDFSHDIFFQTWKVLLHTLSTWSVTMLYTWAPVLVIHTTSRLLVKLKWVLGSKPFTLVSVWVWIWEPFNIIYNYTVSMSNLSKASCLIRIWFQLDHKVVTSRDITWKTAANCPCSWKLGIPIPLLAIASYRLLVLPLAHTN